MMCEYIEESDHAQSESDANNDDEDFDKAMNIGASDNRIAQSVTKLRGKLSSKKSKSKRYAQLSQPSGIDLWVFM